MRIEADDPRIRMVQELLAPQVKKAMDAPRTVENGVLPIFALLKSETVPEQIASGIVVRIGAEHFTKPARLDAVGTGKKSPASDGRGTGRKISCLTHGRSQALGLS